MDERFSASPAPAPAAPTLKEWDELSTDEKLMLVHVTNYKIISSTMESFGATERAFVALRQQIHRLWWALVAVGCFALWLSWRMPYN